MAVRTAVVVAPSGDAPLLVPSRGCRGVVRIRFGEKTRESLVGLGLSASDLEQIQSGDIDWEVIDYPASSATWTLLLEHSEGGQRPITISRGHADELINTWEFERRTAHADDRPATSS